MAFGTWALLISTFSALLSTTAVAGKHSDPCYPEALQKVFVYKSPTFERWKNLPFRINGKAPADYDLAVSRLKPGDVLDFGDGAVFPVQKVLSEEGSGDVTCVVDIGNGWVVGFPKRANADVIDVFSEYSRAQRDLASGGVDVVAVDYQPSRSLQFVKRKKVDIKFLLSDLISDSLVSTKRGKPDLSKEELEKALKALRKFARSTWRFAFIGDFKADQLAYDGERWILLDFNSANVRISGRKDKRNIFQKFGDPDSDKAYYSGPESLYRKLEAEILDVRKKNAK